jgi:hypothetical protein
MMQQHWNWLYDLDVLNNIYFFGKNEEQERAFIHWETPQRKGKELVHDGQRQIAVLSTSISYPTPHKIYNKKRYYCYFIN